MLSVLECDVKGNIIPNMTSECWIPVTYWLFMTQHKCLGNIMYLDALSML